MICPECLSKLMVRDTREDGFIQIRLRVCTNSECDFEAITEEKLEKTEDD